MAYNVTYNAKPFVYRRERGRTYYELSNHLGNVLVTVTDMKIGIEGGTNWEAEYYEATVVSAVDYYPFGSAMAGRKYNQGTYRYGFNGKEEDKEWGRQMIQDYGFRIYNPTIGKFLSVDPLTQSYPWYTPYQFAGNMPIAAIDLDGLEPVVTKEGVLVGYEVMAGDGPTQIAAYLNDPANQKEHGYKLSKTVKWTDIIDYKPNQKYFNTIEGDSRYNKKNKAYTSLNMNETNYIDLGFLASSQNYGDNPKIGSFKESEKGRYDLLVETVRSINNDYQKGKLGKEDSPSIRNYIDFGFNGLPGYNASGFDVLNSEADHRGLFYDRFFVENNEGVRIRVTLLNIPTPLSGFEEACSTCKQEDIVLKTIPKQASGTWEPDPGKPAMTIEFELDTKEERVQARKNFVKDVKKND